MTTLALALCALLLASMVGFVAASFVARRTPAIAAVRDWSLRLAWAALFGLFCFWFFAPR